MFLKYFEVSFLFDFYLIKNLKFSISVSKPPLTTTKKIHFSADESWDQLLHWFSFSLEKNVIFFQL
jgi:hypothetical protein